MADLQLLVQDPETGRFKVGLPSPPRELEGIDLLVQNVVLLYLTNGGRSIVVPGRAGGIREFVGLNYDPNDVGELFADIQLMTTRIDQQIKEEQTRTSRPPSERLQSLNLVDIVPDPEQPLIEVIVQVVNEEQQQQQAIVVT